MLSTPTKLIQFTVNTNLIKSENLSLGEQRPRFHNQYKSHKAKAGKKTTAKNAPKTGWWLNQPI